jgi:hypothetical protein
MSAYGACASASTTAQTIAAAHTRTNAEVRGRTSHDGGPCGHCRLKNDRKANGCDLRAS